MNLTELKIGIMKEDLSVAQLKELSEIVHARLLIERQRETRLKQFTLNVGDRVKISDIRPKKYSGTTGEIIRIKGKRVVVKLDEIFSHIGGTVPGIPLSCVSKIDG